MSRYIVVRDKDGKPRIKDTWDITEEEKKAKEKAKEEEQKKKRQEYQREYYLKRKAKKEELAKEIQSRKKKAYYEIRKEHIKAYNKQYADAHKEERRIANKKYYELHKDKISMDLKKKRLKKKIMEIGCEWCGKDFEEPTKIIQYKKKFFCDETCLGEYLVNKVEDEISEIDLDTMGNIEICMKENWAEW